MGYGRILSSRLENYVVDGFAATIAKYTCQKTHQLAGRQIQSHPFHPIYFLPKHMLMRDGQHHQELDTKLNNRLLYTGGIGIDMLTLYDICLKIEYSFNQLGEKGLFYAKTNLWPPGKIPGFKTKRWRLPFTAGRWKQPVAGPEPAARPADRPGVEPVFFRTFFQPVLFSHQYQRRLFHI